MQNVDFVRGRERRQISVWKSLMEIRVGQCFCVHGKWLLLRWCDNG